MSNLEKTSEVIKIKNYLFKLGLIIDPDIDRITEIEKKPVGFKFVCGNISLLIRKLTLNRHFGVDNKSETFGKLASKLSCGLSFRQKDSSDSIHFNISKSACGKDEANCSVHLDTVSMVAGTDAIGNNNYIVGNIFKHLAIDQYRLTKVIVPSGEDGFVIGYRF
jgi:hypothetical protein